MDKRTSNDQKSDVNNPTSKEYKDAKDHRSRQLNLEDELHTKSKSKK